MGLVKVALLSIFSAVSLFGIYTLSQKAPASRSGPKVTKTTKKAKKASRKKPAAAEPESTTDAAEEMPKTEETPATEEIKPEEPKLELAATTAKPAAPKMEKPAAPPPAAPKPAAPPPAAAPQTVDTIPADVKPELDAAVAKKDLPGLTKLLAHPHAGVRQRVAECLSSMDPAPDAAPPLVQQLADANPLVRRVIVKALARHGASLPASIPALGKALRQDGDGEVRLAAADALAELATGSPERAAAAAGPVLEALDKGPAQDLFSVMAAVGALGESGKPAIPALSHLVRDPGFGESAVAALAQLGSFETFASILADTSSAGSDRKLAIAKGLEKLRPMTPAALAILKKLTEDANEAVQTRALEALLPADPKLPEAIPLFETALASKSESVRNAATKGMDLYATSDPVRNMRKLLTEMMKSPDAVWVQSENATAMKNAKSEGFAALLQILADPQTPPEMRTAAGQVVAISPDFHWYEDKHIEALKKLLETPDQPLVIRTGCAIALVSLKETDSKLMATIMEAAQDKSLDLQVREAAFNKAPRNQKEWLPVSIAAAEECEAPPPADLSDAGKLKRELFYGAVLATFFELDSDSKKLVLPHVVKAIRHDDYIVRLRGLQLAAFPEYATPEVIEAIRPILKNITPGVRSDAARTLAKFGPAAAEAVPDLITLVNDEKEVTHFAAEALAKIAPQDEAAVTAVIKALDRADGRDGTIVAIREFGPSAGAAVPALQKLLPEADKGREQSIVLALGALGEAAKPAIPDIVQRLIHKEEFTRQAAALALTRLKQHAEAAVPDLIKALNDPAVDVVQIPVIKALGAIGTAAKPAIPELEKIAAETKSDRVREATTEVLGILKAEAGADPAKADKTCGG
ncbi:MAG: lyase domain protein repeat-containing protein [Planctomycetaceae bacterium]|nr:lyase domain protein repeat-containing protein [Planctomycetaceae bacterium]